MPSRERGQASVEFVAVLPLIVACALAAGQAAVSGWTLWSAGNAARAGARAAYVGGDGERAAQRSLPGLLREGSRVAADGARVRVRVDSPSLIPGLPKIPVATAAELGPGEDDEG